MKMAFVSSVTNIRRSSRLNKPILYTTDCPKCKVLETKLKERKVDYIEERNVELMLSKKIMSAPVLEVDKKLLSFMEALQWIKQLEVN